MNFALPRLFQNPAISNFFPFPLGLRNSGVRLYHDNCRAQWEVQTVNHCPGWGGSKSWYQGHTQHRTFRHSLKPCFHKSSQIYIQANARSFCYPSQSRKAQGIPNTGNYKQRTLRENFLHQSFFPKFKTTETVTSKTKT